LPTIYNAFINREADISLLAVSGGQPSWGLEPLARRTLNDQLGDIPAHLNAWTKWLGNLRLTHTTYPVLVQIRSASPQPALGYREYHRPRCGLTATVPDKDFAQSRMHPGSNSRNPNPRNLVRGPHCAQKSFEKLLFLERYFGAPVPETNALIKMPGHRPGTLPLNKLPMLTRTECSRPKLFISSNSVRKMEFKSANKNSQQRSMC